MTQKKPKGRYHHPGLRSALIQGALELIAREGSEALTLREVAKRAGVSHTAPYRHFVDKDALLAAVAEEGFRGMDAHMQRQLRGHEQDPERALEACGMAYVTFALERPAHFRVMFLAQIEKGRGRYPALDEAANQTFERLLVTVAAGQKVGRFRGRDPIPVAVTCWSLVHGLAHLLLESLVPEATDPPRFVRKVIALALAGIIEPA